MTARNPLVLIDGKLQELPAGDTVNGATGGVSPAPSLSRLLIYYGYPSSYKGIYNNASVIADISANYDVWVCGDTYENPAHKDYANTQAIIAGVRAAGVKVFGYVPIGTNTSNRSIATMQTSVDHWVALNVDGIFLDEFGFDYQNTRTRQKTMVDYVHGKGLPVCANARTFHDFACDNISELPWGSGDWRYVNFQTYNPSNIALTRWPSDCYLIENFCYDNLGPGNRWDVQERLKIIVNLNATKNVNLWAVAVLAETVGGTIDTTKTGNLTSMTDIMNYVSANAYLYGIPTLGVGGFSFGAGSTPVVGQIPSIASAATSDLSENYTTGVFTRSFGDITISVTNIDTAQSVDVTATPVLSDAPAQAPGATPPGGNSGEIQFNNGGTFAGAANVEIEGGNLKLMPTTIPAAPADGLVLFDRNRAGRHLPSIIDPSGVDVALQPALFANSIYMWLPGADTTVSIAFGVSFTARNSGTGAAQAHPTKTSANAMTSLNRATFGTGTTATGASGIQSSATVAWRGNAAGLGGFFFFARFGIETLASDMRAFVGLSANNAAMAADPSSWANTIGIGKDSADSEWQIITRSASAVTKTPTGITVTAGQILDFLAFAAPNSSKITVRVANAVTGNVLLDNTDLTTNLPANTAFLYMQAHCQSVTGTTAKLLALNRMYCETDL